MHASCQYAHGARTSFHNWMWHTGSCFQQVLTTQLALDRKCVNFLRPRTSGNSSSYLQSAVEEVHSEEWARRTIQYLSDCEFHLKKVALVQSATAPAFSAPTPFRPLPLAQWFETVHSNDILCHLEEMKGVITSTYGRILKMDSTKKVHYMSMIFIFSHVKKFE